MYHNLPTRQKPVLPNFMLVGAIILLIPFAFLGLKSLTAPPTFANQPINGIELPTPKEPKIGQLVHVEPQASAPPTPAPPTPAPPCEESPTKNTKVAVAGSHQPKSNAWALSSLLSKTNGLLFPETDFWVKELDMDLVDLSDPEIEKAELYSLYKEPTDDWVLRAEEKIANKREGLHHALKYVDDADQRITVTTCLFDLGRAKLKGFERKFDEYIRRFQRIINVGFPMIIFMEEDKVSSFNFDRNKRVHIIPFHPQDLVDLYPNYFSRIEEIRASKLYKRQAHMTGWLEQSPQASLKYYNLMVMTKMFMLRHGALLNPFHTQYHVFMDAGHLCGSYIKPDTVNLWRKHMGKMMVTYFDYGAGLQGESHGMAQKAYRHYVGPPYDDHDTWDNEWCCRIVRGGVFGGTPAYIDAVAEVYNEVLAQSLADGYMGTEENILGASYYRFPELFNAFKNEGGDNCAIFSTAQRKGKDGEIYVHPSEGDEWHETQEEADE